MDIEKKLPNLQKNVLLANYTTFNIGGPARYFLVAKNEEEIKKAVKAAKELNLKYFILGGGSNILISDKGFDGLVIKLQVTNYKLQGKTIYAEAGVNLGKLVRFSIENNLSGLEWAAGIPGTLGGAIRGNAGAFNYSISDFVKTVEVLNIQEKETQNSPPTANLLLRRIRRKRTP